jgi:hypothetical protein
VAGEGRPAQDGGVVARLGRRAEPGQQEAGIEGIAGARGVRSCDVGRGNRQADRPGTRDAAVGADDETAAARSLLHHDDRRQIEEMVLPAGSRQGSGLARVREQEIGGQSGDPLPRRAPPVRQERPPRGEIHGDGRPGGAGQLGGPSRGRAQRLVEQ